MWLPFLQCGAALPLCRCTVLRPKVLLTHNNAEHTTTCNSTSRTSLETDFLRPNRGGCDCALRSHSHDRRCLCGAYASRDMNMVMLSVVITRITTLITQHTPKGDDRLSSMSNRPYYPFVHWGKPLSPTEPKQSGCIAAAGKHSDAILLSAALSSLEDAALKILISFNWQIPILATTMKRRSRRRSKASPGKQSSH